MEQRYAAAEQAGTPPAAAAGRARVGIVYLWVVGLRRSGRPRAPVLGPRPAGVYQAVERGRAAAAMWDPPLKQP